MQALDYSKKENWLVNEADENGRDYDVIFFCGTSILSPDLPNGVGTNFDQFKKIGTINYGTVAMALNDKARMFCPVQRQIALNYALQFTDHETIFKQIRTKEPFVDVSAALDYYFEHYNKNGEKPFVLAGHSQGAATLQVLLEDYFLKSEKKKCLKNLICMYALGYGIRKSWLVSLPGYGEYIHFANGEDDFNSIVSWNIEGVGEKSASFLLADPGEETLVINPLNWKRDDTYAPKELNKGVYADNGKSLQEAKYFFTNESKYLFDAQIDLKRGSVVTNGSTNFMSFPGVPTLWGGKSLHTFDARGYYFNLRENVRKRLNSLLARKE